MMILSMSRQAWLFFGAVAMGFAAGIVYDMLRIFRLAINHSDFFTHVEDILYWIFITTAVFYIFLNKNYGEIRAFCVMGLFLGMLLYFMTLSRLVMAISKAIVRLLYVLLSFCYRVIIFPIDLFRKIFARPISAAKNLYKKLRADTKKGLHNFKNYAKMKARGVKKDVDIILKKV